VDQLRKKRRILLESLSQAELSISVEQEKRQMLEEEVFSFRIESSELSKITEKLEKK
jgi:hypothetical protein